jgi:Rrf2 family protein
MMKVTTKGLYGLRIMLELALHYKKSPFSPGQISQSQEIWVKHIHSVIKFLKKAGLVKGIRGPKGGCWLGHPPR